MVRTALFTLWLLALSAPAALAHPGKDGGEGTWGENDRRRHHRRLLHHRRLPGADHDALDRVDRLEKRRPPLAAEKARRARAD